MIIGVDARALSRENPAGIGRYLTRLLECFAKMETEHVFLLYSNKPIRVPFPLPSHMKERLVPGKVGTLWLRYQLPAVLQKDQTEVFWGTEHILPKARKGIRYVLTIHDMALLLHPEWGKWYNTLFQNVFDRSSIRQADRILADSRATKKDVIRLCRIPEGKISVIYIGGADPVPVSPKSGGQIPAENRYFLYLGTIEPRKNITTIIHAFELLCRTEDRIELVLAGGFGWKTGKIRNAVETSFVKTRIHTPGYVSDEEKEKLYAGAEGFLFPSHYEGFGIPVLEAMARGVPVITASNSSLPEVGGDAAFYISDENNAEELAAMMKKILRLSGEEREAVRQQGIRQSGRFSWENCAEETYRCLVSGEDRN